MVSVWGGGMGEQHEGGENMTTRISPSDTGKKERDGQCVCVYGGLAGEQHKRGEEMTTRTSSSDTGH